MFFLHPSNAISLKRFRLGVTVLLLPILLGLALQSFGTARAQTGPSITLSETAGTTGANIKITGSNINICGDSGECQVALKLGNFYMLVGMAYVPPNGQFTFYGPLPRAGDVFVGTASKVMTVPIGPVEIVVGNLTDQTVSATYNVTDNSDGAYSSTTAFEAIDLRWTHTDSLIADGTVSRSWLWGPINYQSRFEPYADSPGGWRLVAYYDKARMEVNDYRAQSVNNPYYVSNGLLVKEMVTDQWQLGDNEFARNLPDNTIPPAGDETPGNPTPQYAVYQLVLNRNVNSDGAIINEHLSQSGELVTMNNLNKYNVTAGHKVNETGHFIASPFWNYLNTTGPVVDLEGQEYVTHNARLFDPLFSATGLPITEPYWTTTMVGGVNKDVLVQLFERRILTYTPSNDPAYQVEMGNVGLQYFQWHQSF